MGLKKCKTLVRDMKLHPLQPQMPSLEIREIVVFFKKFDKEISVTEITSSSFL